MYTFKKTNTVATYGVQNTIPQAQKYEREVRCLNGYSTLTLPFTEQNCV